MPLYSFLVFSGHTRYMQRAPFRYGQLVSYSFRSIAGLSRHSLSWIEPYSRYGKKENYCIFHSTACIYGDSTISHGYIDAFRFLIDRHPPNRFFPDGITRYRMSFPVWYACTHSFFVVIYYSHLRKSKIFPSLNPARS
jgi:hypothetical protein